VTDIRSEFLTDHNIIKWKKTFFKKENQTLIAESFVDDYIKIDSQKISEELVKSSDIDTPNHKPKYKNQILNDLFSKKYRLQMYLVILLNVLNQMTGINVFQLYSTIIFQKLNYNNPENLTVALGFMHLFAGLTTNQMIERFGRKTLISLGLFLICVSFIGLLSSLLFNFSFLGLVFIFSYKVSFCMACGGSIMIYQSEILPAYLIPFGIIFQSVFVILVSYSTIPLVNSIGIFALFMIFLGFALVGFVLFFGYAVETKEKKDSVVIEEFLNKKFWT
jgi:MFS family permease